MFCRSLSARRAWIEIKIWRVDFGHFTVALRKESVDRNFYVLLTIRQERRRSPQGERG